MKPRDHAAALPLRNRPRPGFTFIELVAVIVVLGILAGVALPKYISYRDKANKSADEASLAGIRSALNDRYMSNRSNDASSTSWVTEATQVAAVMEGGKLPDGITLNGAMLQDRRGNTYVFVAETATTPAKLNAPTGPSGLVSGSGGAEIPAPLLFVGAGPWLARPRRADSMVIR